MRITVILLDSIVYELYQQNAPSLLTFVQFQFQSIFANDCWIWCVVISDYEPLWVIHRKLLRKLISIVNTSIRFNSWCKLSQNSLQHPNRRETDVNYFNYLITLNQNYCMMKMRFCAVYKVYNVNFFVQLYNVQSES